METDTNPNEGAELETKKDESDTQSTTTDAPEPFLVQMLDAATILQEELILFASLEGAPKKAIRDQGKAFRKAITHIRSLISPAYQESLAIERGETPFPLVEGADEVFTIAAEGPTPAAPGEAN